MDHVKVLVQQAARRALNWQARLKSGIGTKEKPAQGGLVTDADIDIDRFLCAHLARKFAHCGILSEESRPDVAALKKDWCWVLDPIDGTRDFVAKGAGWVVQLGLLRYGIPVLGVVAQPARGILNWGMTCGKGKGAWSRKAGGNARQLFLEPAPDLNRLVSSQYDPSPEIGNIASAIGVRAAEHTQIGSTGVKISLVAQDHADVYVLPSDIACLWDTCGPEAILTAAGGILSDLTGRPLLYSGDTLTHSYGLLACKPSRQRELIRQIAPITSRFLSER